MKWHFGWYRSSTKKLLNPCATVLARMQQHWSLNLFFPHAKVFLESGLLSEISGVVFLKFLIAQSIIQPRILGGLIEICVKFVLHCKEIKLFVGKDTVCNSAKYDAFTILPECNVQNLSSWRTKVCLHSATNHVLWWVGFPIFRQWSICHVIISHGWFT